MKEHLIEQATHKITAADTHDVNHLITLYIHACQLAETREDWKTHEARFERDLNIYINTGKLPPRKHMLVIANLKAFFNAK